jgi:hypothetical protein
VNLVWDASLPIDGKIICLDQAYRNNNKNNMDRCRE